MTGKNQLSLEFPHRPYMGREDFIVSSCNAEAFAAVDRWPEWPFSRFASTDRKTAEKPT